MGFREILVLALILQFTHGGLLTNRPTKDQEYSENNDPNQDHISLSKVVILYCDPNCQNDGICVQNNFCQCVDGFRGDLCQYDADRCSLRKAGFNGNYTCFIYTKHILCNLSCPENYKLNSNDTYLECKYEEDKFDKPVPRCDYHQRIAVTNYYTTLREKPLPGC